MIVFTTIRWPHRVTLKAMIALAAISALSSHYMICLSFKNMHNFAAKGHIVNQVMDEMTKLTNVFKNRLINTLIGANAFDFLHRHTCWYGNALLKQINHHDYIAFYFIQRLLRLEGEDNKFGQSIGQTLYLSTVHHLLQVE